MMHAQLTLAALSNAPGHCFRATRSSRTVRTTPPIDTPTPICIAGPASGSRAAAGGAAAGRSRRDADVEPPHAPRGVSGHSRRRRRPAHPQPAAASRRTGLHRQPRRRSIPDRRRRAAAGVREDQGPGQSRARHRQPVRRRAASARWDDYETLPGAAGGDPTMPTWTKTTPAAMCYTSGTTGKPKGVVYSHRAIALHSFAISLPDSFFDRRARTRSRRRCRCFTPTPGGCRSRR